MACKFRCKDDSASLLTVVCLRVAHSFAGPTPVTISVSSAPPHSDQKRKTALSSAFVSGTRRLHSSTKTHAPGPAFYKPEQHDRKSFLLNAQRRWV